MDPITVALLSVALVFFLIIFGVHIGVALSLTSVAGLWLITGRIDIAVSILGTTAYSAIMDYIFAVIPLFVLMGLFAHWSGATSDLFAAAEVGLRRVRGGVGISTVAANAVFAAITGVSVASAAVFSKLAIPEMAKLNYQPRFSYGIVASSSLLGMLIPPSVLMIVYGVLTGQSIGRLFLAGVGPGLLVAAMLSVSIWLMVRFRPELAPGVAAADARRQSRLAMLAIVLKPWGVYVLIIAVLGGIYGGVFTPTEAGAVGAAGALLLVLSRRRFTLRGFKDVLMESARTTASIFLLLMAAQMYSRMLALSGLASAFSNWAVALPVAPLTLIVVFIVIFLLLGAIIDSISILLLTMPIMFPVVTALGFDPIWFGMVCVLAIELGLLTPPFGMSVFAMKSALGPEVPIEEIFIGAAPFLVVLLLALAVVVLVPELSLFLPRLLS